MNHQSVVDAAAEAIAEEEETEATEAAEDGEEEVTVAMTDLTLTTDLEEVGVK